MSSPHVSWPIFLFMLMLQEESEDTPWVNLLTLLCNCRAWENNTEIIASKLTPTNGAYNHEFRVSCRYILVLSVCMWMKWVATTQRHSSLSLCKQQEGKMLPCSQFWLLPCPHSLYGQYLTSSAPFLCCCQPPCERDPSQGLHKEKPTWGTQTANCKIRG